MDNPTGNDKQRTKKPRCPVCGQDCDTCGCKPSKHPPTDAHDEARVSYTAVLFTKAPSRFDTFLLIFRL